MAQELDRPLPPEQAKRLAAHLVQCARCRAIRAALYEAEGLLGEPSWPDTSPDLTERVLARLPKDRRAVLPTAPAWTRASGIVVAALFLVLVGIGSALLLTGTALGYGDWALVPESGRSVIAAGWDGLRDLASAFGTAAAALWQTLRWPWALVGGGAVLGAGALWAWLWLRSRRWRL